MIDIRQDSKSPKISNRYQNKYSPGYNTQLQGTVDIYYHPQSFDEVKQNQLFVKRPKNTHRCKKLSDSIYKIYTKNQRSKTGGLLSSQDVSSQERSEKSLSSVFPIQSINIQDGNETRFFPTEFVQRRKKDDVMRATTQHKTKKSHELSGAYDSNIIANKTQQRFLHNKTVELDTCVPSQRNKKTEPINQQKFNQKMQIKQILKNTFQNHEKDSQNESKQKSVYSPRQFQNQLQSEIASNRKNNFSKLFKLKAINRKQVISPDPNTSSMSILKSLCTSASGQCIIDGVKEPKIEMPFGNLNLFESLEQRKKRLTAFAKGKEFDSKFQTIQDLQFQLKLQTLDTSKLFQSNLKSLSIEKGQLVPKQQKSRPLVEFRVKNTCMQKKQKLILLQRQKKNQKAGSKSKSPEQVFCKQLNIKPSRNELAYILVDNTKTNLQPYHSNSSSLNQINLQVPVNIQEPNSDLYQQEPSQFFQQENVEKQAQQDQLGQIQDSDYSVEIETGRPKRNETRAIITSGEVQLSQATVQSSNNHTHIVEPSRNQLHAQIISHEALPSKPLSTMQSQYTKVSNKIMPKNNSIQVFKQKDDLSGKTSLQNLTNSQLEEQGSKIYVGENIYQQIEVLSFSQREQEIYEDESNDQRNNKIEPHSEGYECDEYFVNLSSQKSHHSKATISECHQPEMFETTSNILRQLPLKMY